MSGFIALKKVIRKEFKKRILSLYLSMGTKDYMNVPRSVHGDSLKKLNTGTFATGHPFSMNRLDIHFQLLLEIKVENVLFLEISPSCGLCKRILGMICYSNDVSPFLCPMSALFTHNEI